MSDLLKKNEQFANLSWMTWANPSQLLFCYDRPERFAHSWSFVMSNSLTVPHLSWAIWAKEQWANSQPWCTPWSLTPQWDAHGGAWLRGMMHTAELDSVVCCTLLSFLRNLGHLTPLCDAKSRSLTLQYNGHQEVWIRSVHHTAELDYFENVCLCVFEFVTLVLVTSSESIIL